MTVRWKTLFLVAAWTAPLPAQELSLPLRDGSVRFYVLGDMGTGDRYAYEVASQVIKYYPRFKPTFAILLGDNLYGSERPQDFVKKFVTPYKALLDADVKFYAALGNHDDPNQRYYGPFGMDGERYYTYKQGNVRFFVLDTSYLDPDQVEWLDKELAASGSEWKIAYFHHPLYTTAGRGPEVEIRKVLEPLFVKYNVNVVFQGHEHIYERLKPQGGIYYFTAGAAAKLRRGDANPGRMTEATFDTDRSFLMVEITEDALYFQAVSRTGETVDQGALRRLVRRTPATQATVTRSPAIRSPGSRTPATRAPATRTRDPKPQPVVRWRWAGWVLVPVTEQQPAAKP
ncbi:MAG: metallophosphoesterase family protein [Gemmatimonadales bacterium]